MKIFIDADGCPVTRLTISTAKESNIAVTVISDTSHEFHDDYADIITVDKGADSVDFRLANMIKRGDIAITQDYGLAAMILAKGAIPIRQDGLLYDNSNIDALLLARHTAKKIRRSGDRLRGASKRTSDEDLAFLKTLREIINKQEGLEELKC